MEALKSIPMMISLPKHYRDQLRKIAAEQNLENPDSVASAASLVREIIVKHLDNVNSKLQTQGEKNYEKH